MCGWTISKSSTFHRWEVCLNVKTLSKYVYFQLLARAFQDMGQDENDQYAGLAVYLATDYFLEHQSKDVRLLVACCIADVFRIFAPEAPFRDVKHLKVPGLFN